MRVALFLPTFDGGGAERVFLQLAPWLREAGCDVELVVGEARGALADAVPDDLPVVELHTRKLRWALPRLVAYLRARRPSVLLSTLEHANIVALTAASLARTRTRVVVRVANTIGLSERTRGSAKGAATVALARRAYTRADLVVAVSQGVADDLAATTSLEPGRIRVIPNPAVPADLAGLIAKPPDYPWFDDGDPPVVLGMGRLTPQKNFPLLLRSFARIRQDRAARLVLLGEGPQRPELERLADELGVKADVCLPGFVVNPYPYLSRAGCFVLSSNWEGMPGALIQALASGAPAVATDCRSGPREVLQDGAFGQIVPVGDEVALAGAIAATLERRPPPAPPEAWNRYAVRGAAAAYLEALRQVGGA